MGEHSTWENGYIPGVWFVLERQLYFHEMKLDTPMNKDLVIGKLKVFENIVHSANI